MGEGRGVVEKAEVSNQAGPLECGGLNGRLAHYGRKMFRFEINPRDVRALSYSHGHWLAWLRYRKCGLVVYYPVNRRIVYEDEQLANL